MKRYARRRDDCEAEIVTALESVGWAVHRNSEDGVPDLLASRGDEAQLLECKDVHAEHGRKRALKGKHNDPDPAYRELTPQQVTWWRRWLAKGGKPPVIVHNVAEALSAVGWKEVDARHARHVHIATSHRLAAMEASANRAIDDAVRMELQDRASDVVLAWGSVRRLFGIDVSPSAVAKMEANVARLRRMIPDGFFELIRDRWQAESRGSDQA